MIRFLLSLNRALERVAEAIDRMLVQPPLRVLHRTVDPVLLRLPRPLDPFRSIKIKLSILLGVSGLAGIIVFWIGLGWIAYHTAITGAVVGVVTLQIFAHGMTRPLRDMTVAARAMARGDYSIRVRSTSRDEVGDLARAFNQMSADLAAADQRRRELIANVSHELRTPVTALHGVLENLVDGVSSADPATLRAALAQSERLGRLVTELLDLSRLDAGVVRLDRVPIDVTEFLSDVTTEAHLVSPDTPFELHIADGLRPGYADPARLHQVFTNLLENAARHSPPGAAVTVSAETVGSSTVFEVTDRGVGIPADQRERLFERFSRGDRAARDGGTGLGLAIARWVVDLHDGTIAITDPLDGIGCRIRFTLPNRIPAIEDSGIDVRATQVATQVCATRTSTIAQPGGCR